MGSGNFKNLLVGIDLSNYSKLVVKEAQKISAHLGIPVTYIYVLQDLSIYRNMFAVERPHVTENFQQEIRKKYGLLKTDKILIKFGTPSDVIIEAAEELEAPMIMVGYRGGHKIARFFIGSTAESLAFLSKYPVWIHRGKSAKIPRKFFMPSDLGVVTEEALLEIDPLKKSFKAQLQVHHVYQEPMPLMDYAAWAIVSKELRQEDNKQMERFKKKHPNLKTSRSIGSVFYEIQEKSKKFDLIALSPKRAGHPRPLAGGILRKVIRTGENPILILP